MEITTIKGGFIMNQKEYKIIGDITPQTETQIHIETDMGTILLDTSVVIDGRTHNELRTLINSLENV